MKKLLLCLCLLAPIAGLAATAFNAVSSVSTPRRQSVAISTANPNRDGTGALSALFSANASGPSRVDAIQIAAVSATTRGFIRLYVNGVLLDEIPVLANVPGPLAKTWVLVYTPPAVLLLAPGDVLQVSTNNAEPFNVTAFGWDY